MQLYLHFNPIKFSTMLIVRLTKWFLPAIIFCLLFSCQREKGSGQSLPEQAQDSIVTDAALDTIDISYLTGKFEPVNDPNFAEIPDSIASRPGLLLRKEALDALIRMISAAGKAGHRITVISATRNFDYQREIWEKKWTGKRILSNGKNAAEAYPSPEDRARAILLYSSMPGTSRHHWGTDFDINDLNNAYFETGEGASLFMWMEENAADFGFCRPYTAKGPHRTSGYEEEKWHWSYMPLSTPLTKAAANKLKNEDISGFKGEEASNSIDVVGQYVLGIDPFCLQLVNE